MNALNSFLSPALLRAVGFTLLHSLWQGALLAVAAALLLVLLHRHRAVVRYRVAGGALGLVVAWAGLTFGYYYQGSPVVGAGSASQTIAGHPRPESSLDQRPTPSKAGFRVALVPGRFQALAGVGSAYVEQHLPLLVGGWLLGILAMTLRFLGGLAYVQRLRRHRVAALPPAWQTRLDRLVRQAGLRQPVQLLASALVPSPMVVGLFKPLVLLPLSAATSLPAQELEMILAHEVAHILRKDYLVNLLQAVAEVVFFYHPAVWFLSACLRTEREICCDDLATELCGDSQLLAQALSSLAEMSYAAGQPPRLAVAALGPDGSLLGRVRRLVEHRPTAPTFAEGFCAACVVLVSIVLLVGSTVTSLGAAPEPAFDKAMPPAVDWKAKPTLTLPPVKSTTSTAPSAAEIAAAQPQTAASPLARTPSVVEPPKKPLTSRAAPPARPAPNPRNRLERALKKDGLLPDLRNYEYTLTSSRLVINGQTQPDALADKYRHLYEAETGQKLSPKTTVSSAHHEATTRSEEALATRQPAPKSRPVPPAPPAKPTPPRPDNAAILRELQTDGLVPAGAKSWELELTRAGLTVGGQPRPESQTTKYRALLHIPKDVPGTNSVHITVTE